MSAIADQVNNKLGKSLQATVFNVGNGHSELSFKSTKTGEQHYISISNVQGDAAKLNLNNLFSKNSLNAKFTIDGVTFQRSSNTVDNAIQGLSFKLKQVTSGQSVELSVSNDTESAHNTIESFIDKYNDINSLIRQKTHVSSGGNYGILYGKRTLRNITFSMRNDVSFPVSSLTGQSTINSLSDIGIELKNDGSMYIEDSSELKSALKSSPEKVKQLFTADDGLISRLQDTIHRAIKGDHGVLDTIKNGIDNKIDRVDDRIEHQNEYLENQSQMLHKKFAHLRQVIARAQMQSRRLSLFQSRIG